MRGTRGFSLIELLIVVAIILIIAAMAVPSYLHSKIMANEASAIAALRTLNTAQISYYSVYPTVGFASSMSNLAGTSCAPPSSSSACLIDQVLASGTKSGYQFALSGASTTPVTSYSVIATPVLVNASGDHYFCTLPDSVVRVSSSAISTCDPTIPPQN